MLEDKIRVTSEMCTALWRENAPHYTHSSVAGARLPTLKNSHGTAEREFETTSKELPK